MISNGSLNVLKVAYHFTLFDQNNMKGNRNKLVYLTLWLKVVLEITQMEYVSYYSAYRSSAHLHVSVLELIYVIIELLLLLN